MIGQILGQCQIEDEEDSLVRKSDLGLSTTDRQVRFQCKTFWNLTKQSNFDGQNFESGNYVVCLGFTHVTI